MDNDTNDEIMDDKKRQDLIAFYKIAIEIEEGRNNVSYEVMPNGISITTYTLQVTYRVLNTLGGIGAYFNVGEETNPDALEPEKITEYEIEVSNYGEDLSVYSDILKSKKFRVYKS